MKKLVILVLFIAGFNKIYAQSTLITPGISQPNIMANSYQNGGIVPPRMNSSQIRAISSPTVGMLVYDLDANCLRMFDGTAWRCQTPDAKLVESNFFRSDSFQDCQGNAVIVKGDFIYTIGEFKGSTTFVSMIEHITLTSVGNTDAFVAKFDKYGTLIWIRQFSNPLSIKPIAIDVDANNNVYVAGNHHGPITFETNGTGGMASMGNSNNGSDIFFVKYDSNGLFNYMQKLAGSDADSLTAMKLDSLGNIYLTGGFRGSMDLYGAGGVIANTVASAGQMDLFVAKYSVAGNYLGVKTSGGATTDEIGTALGLGTGNIILLAGKANANLDGLSPSSYYGNFIAKLNSGFVCTAISSVPNPDVYSIVIQDIAEDIHGNIYVSSSLDYLSVFGAESITATTFCLIKLNSLFGLQWSKYTQTPTIGDPIPNPSQVKSNIEIDNDGNIVWSSNQFGDNLLLYTPNSPDPILDRPATFSQAYGDYDFCLTKVNATDGKVLWHYRNGSTTRDLINGLFLDSDGSIYTIGFFSSLITFGGFTTGVLYNEFIVNKFHE